jgi:circadian clock protein KaiC
MTQWNNVEDFVLDGVIILSTRVDDNGRRNREIEVMKMRGEYFLSGKHPLKISGEGFSVFPMIKPEPFKIMSKERLSTGVPGIDDMMFGGVLSSDCTLVAGSTGAGKTLLSLEFIKEGVRNGDNCLYVSLEESIPVLVRNANGIGFDLEKAEKEGKVTLIYESAVDFIPEEFLLKLKELIEKAGIKRIVIDSVTSCCPSFRNSTHYRDSLSALIGLLKSNNITSYIVSEMPELFGTFRVTDSGTSFIVDNIILLRYVEVESSMDKAISVLKMRGSPHEKGIRNYKITDKGIVVMDKFKGFESVLSGTPRSIAAKIEGFFE